MFVLNFVYLQIQKMNSVMFLMFWVVALGHATDMILNEEYQVAFQPLHTLDLSKHVFKYMLGIRWPVKLDKFDFPELECSRSESGPLRLSETGPDVKMRIETCELAKSYSLVLKSDIQELENKLLELTNNVKVSLPGISSMKRQKRNIMGNLFGPIYNFMGLVSTKDIETIESQIKVLENGQSKLYDSGNQLRKGILSLGNLTDSRINNLLQTMSHNQENIKIAFSNVSMALDDVEYRITEVTSHLVQLRNLVNFIARAIHMQTRIISQIEMTYTSLLSGIDDIQRGNLPYVLIPPNQLEDIKNTVTEVLHDRLGEEYELTFNNTLKFYKFVKVIGTWTDKALYVIIDIPFHRKNGEFLLYAVHSQEMEIGESSKATVIRKLPSYLAIGKDHYVTLSDEEYLSCDKKHCHRPLVPLIINERECILNLFNKKQGLAAKSCKFDVIIKKLDDHVRIIDQYVFLSNVSGNLTMKCTEGMSRLCEEKLCIKVLPCNCFIDWNGDKIYFHPEACTLKMIRDPPRKNAAFLINYHANIIDWENAGNTLEGLKYPHLNELELVNPEVVDNQERIQLEKVIDNIKRQRSWFVKPDYNLFTFGKLQTGWVEFLQCILLMILVVAMIVLFILTYKYRRVILRLGKVMVSKQLVKK
ncbi:unnamed protein product [Owenia fusiformis]|uniref:Uncharacterized protein n=1 Tax=Owenia fusiformis TaxID=6347 RepID=A0A8J1TK00_OWEFU|nr:unnamed protein product [Owenia fusiformis]